MKEKLREWFLKVGVENLVNYELLVILLWIGIKYEFVMDLLNWLFCFFDGF